MNLKQELHVFWTAVMFYTRIPCPRNLPFSQDLLERSTRYFPLVGWIVGGFSAIIFALLSVSLPLSISIIGAMIAGVLLTGAFHEDGFADVCDGFGGGTGKENILTIMKDSRTGAFGVIGVALLLLLKFQALVHIAPALIVPSLVTGHVLSRSLVMVLRRTIHYVRENEDSKAKPLAKQSSFQDFIIAMAFGIISLMLLPVAVVLWALPLSVVAMLYCRRIFLRGIGGYTGDCLGATQQVCETLFYVAVAGVTWTST